MLCNMQRSSRQNGRRSGTGNWSEQRAEEMNVCVCPSTWDHILLKHETTNSCSWLANKSSEQQHTSHSGVRLTTGATFLTSSSVWGWMHVFNTNTCMWAQRHKHTKSPEASRSEIPHQPSGNQLIGLTGRMKQNTLPSGFGVDTSSKVNRETDSVSPFSKNTKGLKRTRRMRLNPQCVYLLRKWNINCTFGPFIKAVRPVSF